MQNILRFRLTGLIFLPGLILLLIASTCFSDGFIVIPRVPVSVTLNNAFPLEVKYHHVDVDINDQHAVTSIDQEFYNSTPHTLEGYYIFPIPKNAVIKNFSMYIQGKEMKAELLDAVKAKNIYQDIVRNMKDPALLEYSSQEIYKLRIFPIEPHSTKRIKISYSEILPKDNNTLKYLYPLNTEKFSSKPLKNVSIKVNLECEDTLNNIYCISHDVEIVRKDKNRAVISFEEKNTKPDTDFKLFYSVSGNFGISGHTYKDSEDDGYFFLSLSPGYIPDDFKVSGKDITFILDTSGSMAGEKIEKAKNSLLFCINNLNQDDRFQIIRFSTEAEALFENRQYANKKNIREATNFIGKFKAIGGTNIEEAITLALEEIENTKTTNSSRPNIIVFITDGKPTIGERDEDKLLNIIKKSNTKNTRIFTFGIGFDINSHLLDKLTSQTRAYRSYISPDEDIETEISNFYMKISSPVLSSLSLKTNKKVKLYNVYPNLKDLPDLFKGSSLILIGRYSGSGQTKLILKGSLGKEKKQYEYSMYFTDQDNSSNFIPPLWATRRIGYLLDQIRLGGEEKEIVDEIVMLARRYGIITPYTSYLILEDESNRTTKRELDVRFQTLGNFTDEGSVLADRIEKEYSGSKQKSGEISNRASEEFQLLNKAENAYQMNQGKERLYFDTKEGESINIANQVKNIGGRAFYNTQNVWIDSDLQEMKSDKIIRLKFASEEYFKLIKSSPDSFDILSLGRNIRFTMDDKIYEIYE